MLYIASDHSGFDMKDMIIQKLNEENIEVIDATEKLIEGDDYPDMVKNVCSRIENKDLAIIICGTGIGSSMAANKIKGIRAAVCHDEYTAKMTRIDNNANVLCLGARTDYAKDEEKVLKIVKAFINTEFSNDERHLRRINKIKEMENNI